MNQIEIEACLKDLKRDAALKTPSNPLLQGWKSFSQCDEDGIIRECLQRIQAETELSGTCIEIGCGNGLENNTHQLLIDGFSGVWCDADSNNIEHIYTALGGLTFGNLLVEQSMITLESVSAFCKKSTRFLGTTQVDFLSLDIDGNDIHVLPELITNISPKLLCVEYNAKFRPGSAVSIDYQHSFTWNGDDYFGASLDALNDVLQTLGYCLVCCNAAGSNAFFVDNKHVAHFELTHLDDLYMPPRYHLCLVDSGHRSSLSWLRQCVNQKPSHNVYKLNCKHRIYANTSYAGFLTYADDMVIGSSLRDRSEFQEAEIKDVVSHLKLFYNFEPRLFVDIGGNIGTHSIYAIKSQLFEQAACYEIEQDNYNLLLANVAINNLEDRIQCFNLGISNRVGSTVIELSKHNYGDHRIAGINRQIDICGESEWGTKSAKLTTLDDALSALDTTGENALIWIDTQGHEGHVFSGGTCFWATRGRKFVVCEYWPYGLERSGGAEMFFAFLKNCRSIYDLGNKQWSSGQATTTEELESKYSQMLSETRSDFHPHTNLLLVM